MAIFISYPILIWDIHIRLRLKARGLTWVEGWYENCHVIIYLSYILLSDKFAYLISYVESKARKRSALNVVIWVFCMGKKAVSPTWPGDMFFFFFFFFFLQKSCMTHMTHYHTFSTPQGWYVLESHVSITYLLIIHLLENIFMLHIICNMKIFSSKCMMSKTTYWASKY